MKKCVSLLKGERERKRKKMSFIFFFSYICHKTGMGPKQNKTRQDKTRKKWNLIKFI